MNRVYIGGDRCSAVMLGTVPIINFIEEDYIENSVARSYLSTIPYNDNDYTYTYITDYYNIQTDYRKDQPFGKILSWEGNYSSYAVYVSLNSDYSNARVLTTTGDSITVYNVIPETVYYWKVVGISGNDETIIKTGTFNMTGSLRMIKADSVLNIRDIGGWNAGNSKLKYGKIIRGGEFDDTTHITISNEDIQTLRNDVGITAELDLRSSNEAYLRNYSALGQDITFARNAINNYVNGVSSSPYLIQRALRTIINWLGQGKTIYLHCQGGADRTGTICMIIEAICGVSESDCCKDWETTSFSSYGLRQRNSNGYNYKGTIEYLKTYNGDSFQEKVISWAKTTFENEYGWVGLTDTEITSLQSYMIE